MGLEKFTSDNSSSSSSSTNSSSNKIREPNKSNQASNCNQSFGPENRVSPRDIKYQVKTFNFNWVKQFSHYRSEDGEIVMYISDYMIEDDNVTLAVFTGIRSFNSEHPYSDELDVMITKWNLEENNQVGVGNNIEYNDSWKSELVQTLEDMLSNVKMKHTGD